jgi:hypothetical protein
MKDILREWVEYLKHHGESSWDALPKQRNGKCVSHISWKAWERKGFIISKFSPEKGRTFCLPEKGEE